MYACIDLGSNSFHLLIGEWDDGRIRIVERCSEKVQLGEAVVTTGLISDAAFQRGLACLENFRALMRRHPIRQYWALGTNAFRLARNTPDFLTAARDMGIRISVISGVQEAVLIYAGVITSLPLNDERRLIIDIGGGSTEVIAGHGHERIMTESLPAGTVGWRDRFFAKPSSDTRVLEARMDAGLEAALAIFEPAGAAVARAGWDTSYASSGTVKMLKYICENQGYGENRITSAALRELKGMLAAGIAKDGPLPGLKEERRELLLPGWCVAAALMEVFDIEVLNFSATALREGMLDFLVRNKKTMPIMRASHLPKVNRVSSL